MPLDVGVRNFEKTADQFIKTLDESEVEAVYSYQGSEAFPVNAYLRDVKPLVTMEELGFPQSDIKTIGLGLDSAISKGHLAQDMQLYRGIGYPVPDDIAKLKPGDIFTDKGYVSTSASVKTANEISLGAYLSGDVQPDAKAGMVAIINAPKGTNAAVVPGDPMLGGQYEVILPRGSSFRVVAAKKDSIVLNYIPPKADLKKYSDDQPRDDHGRWTDGGVSDEAPTAINRVLQEWFTREEDGYRSKRFETALIQDKNGNITKISDQNEGQVRLSDSALAKLDGAVFSHNHPRSGAPPPSPNDVYVGVAGNVAELRVVTSKETFSIKPPTGGWDNVKGEKKDLLGDIISPKIYFGTLRANSNKEIDTMLHEHWTDLSKQYGFTYSRTSYTPKLVIRTGKK